MRFIMSRVSSSHDVIKESRDWPKYLSIPQWRNWRRAFWLLHATDHTAKPISLYCLSARFPLSNTDLIPLKNTSAHKNSRIRYIINIHFQYIIYYIIKDGTSYIRNVPKGGMGFRVWIPSLHPIEISTFETCFHMIKI